MFVLYLVVQMWRLIFHVGTQRGAESGCDGGLSSLDHDCSAAESRAFWRLKKGILAMQPYSLYNTFPRDALSYGEEQA